LSSNQRFKHLQLPSRLKYPKRDICKDPCNYYLTIRHFVNKIRGTSYFVEQYKTA